jgi:hypothetical protein
MQATLNGPPLNPLYLDVNKRLKRTSKYTENAALIASINVFDWSFPRRVTLMDR